MTMTKRVFEKYARLLAETEVRLEEDPNHSTSDWIYNLLKKGIVSICQQENVRFSLETFEDRINFHKHSVRIENYNNKRKIS